MRKAINDALQKSTPIMKQTIGQATPIIKKSIEQATPIIKQSIDKVTPIMKQTMNQANSIINTMVSTSRVVKWSVILVSSGVFLFGASKVIDSVRSKQ